MTPISSMLLQYSKDQSWSKDSGKSYVTFYQMHSHKQMLVLSLLESFLCFMLCGFCFKQRINAFHCVAEVLSQLCLSRLVQSVVPETVWLQPTTLSSLPLAEPLLGTQPYLSGSTVAVLLMAHEFRIRKSNPSQIHHLQVSSDLFDEDTALWILWRVYC